MIPKPVREKIPPHPDQKLVMMAKRGVISLVPVLPADCRRDLVKSIRTDRRHQEADPL